MAHGVQELLHFLPRLSHACSTARK